MSDLRERYASVQDAETRASSVKRALLDAMPLGATTGEILIALNGLLADYIHIWVMSEDGARPQKAQTRIVEIE